MIYLYDELDPHESVELLCYRTVEGGRVRPLRNPTGSGTGDQTSERDRSARNNGPGDGEIRQLSQLDDQAEQHSTRHSAIRHTFPRRSVKAISPPGDHDPSSSLAI